MSFTEEWSGGNGYTYWPSKSLSKASCQQDYRRLFKGVSSKALLECKLNVRYVFSAPLHAIFLMPLYLGQYLVNAYCPSWVYLLARRAESRRRDTSLWRSSRCRSSWCKPCLEVIDWCPWNWRGEILSDFICWTTYSQCSNNKQGSQVDLDDHVKVILDESVHHMAD